MKKLFTIPVTWEMYGKMEIQAKSLEEALEIAIKDAPLPEGNYVDGSILTDEYGMSDQEKSGQNIL